MTIFQFLNSFADKFDWLDNVIIFFANYFGFLLFAVAIILVFFYRQKSDWLKVFLFLLLSVFGSWILAQIIKYFYFSPRPFIAFSDVINLIEHGGNDSFPSGHATFFFALATTLYYIMSNTRYRTAWVTLFFAGAFLISIARVMAGLHFPIDILAGAIIGSLFSLIIQRFFSIVEDRFNFI